MHAAKAMGKFLSARDSDPRSSKVPFENDVYDEIEPPHDFIISEEIWSLVDGMPPEIAVREWDFFCKLCEWKGSTDEIMVQHTESHSHNMIRGLKKIEHGRSRREPKIESTYRDTDWESAVLKGEIPSPPLNRRPVQI